MSNRADCLRENNTRVGRCELFLELCEVKISV